MFKISELHAKIKPCSTITKFLWNTRHNGQTIESVSEDDFHIKF